MFPLYFLAPLKNKLTQSLILEFYSPWIRGIQDFPCSQMDLAYSCDSPVAHVWAFWNVGASWIHSAPGAFAGQGLALPLLWQEGRDLNSMVSTWNSCLSTSSGWSQWLARLWDLLLACSASVARQGGSHGASPAGSAASVVSQDRRFLITGC